MHSPVLLTEVLEALKPRTGGVYVDGTIGGAGHAAAILAASGPEGWLLGIDRDGAALKAAAARLEEFPGRFELREGPFDRLGEWRAEGSCDGVVFDLGVSSPQLDEPGRGFSFRHDGPLDMRMSTKQALTAADVVNSAPVDELERIFSEYGEEPRARFLARRIEQERKVQPLTTTGQLAALIERLLPRHGARLHPATRAFQAIRMHVNDELGQLERGLWAAMRVLRHGGRLAVITFHSLEARLVKRFGNERSREYDFDGEVDIPELRRPRLPEMRWVVRRALTARESELTRNPRARSAQLRVLERIVHGS
jgi:16S rRNA (cytosine1402-N4)-methyltransferase